MAVAEDAEAASTCSHGTPVFGALVAEVGDMQVACCLPHRPLTSPRP